ncbi:MAG: 3-deoxy-D-manno-octulosonic acid transferase [Rickettsiales bacterium]|nr:3-deoxy-D-manno-octulosonic acid transferase [Rickettsiales bacterium]
MTFYRILSILLFPFLELYLFYRVYKKKEDKKRLRERFGEASQNRPEGDIIWLHAVSVGEVNSALILIDELFKTFPRSFILFTTTTLTSASIVAAKIPQFKGRVIHQFLPIDSYGCVKDFLNFWEPSKVIFVESEIWPNLIFESHKIGALVFLVNARISNKTFFKWNLASKIGFRIFDYFDLIFVQSSEDQKRFLSLSKNEVLFFGNLKSQALNLNVDNFELNKLQDQIGRRKFWLAASTHKGEEEIILQTHLELKKDFSDLLTIIVPRHPARAEEIKNLFGEIKLAQRSQKQSITNATEIYLADTLNELGTFYSLANFAFIGGSLLEIGGHNPFEAIKLNCAVISGAQVFNFKEIYKSLEEQNACVIINSATELSKKVGDFLRNHDAPKAMSVKALDVIKNSDNIAKKIVEKIDQVLA